MLNHIDTRVILPRYEGSFMVYRPKWNRKQKYPQNTHTLLISENMKSSL